MYKAGQQMRTSVRAAIVIGICSLAAICVAQIQSSSAGQMQTGTHQASTNPSLGPAGTAEPMDGGPSPFPDTGRQKRNEERQRRLVSDTQRLLTLTTQLKTEVASTGAEKMSPEMLKQMEEIEKLAKSVKDKMRD